MPRALSIAFPLLLAGLLQGLSCSGGAPAVPPSASLPAAVRPPLPAWPSLASPWIDSTLAGMSLEEKVGQIVMAVAYSQYVSDESDEAERAARLVRDRHLGGIIVTHGDVLETAALTNRLQRLARIPLLFSGDYERGLAMRVRRATVFPDAMALGATRDTTYAYRAGRAITREMRAVGVHQNYAPVADVNVNPLNPVINTRAFGEDRELVAAMAAAFVRGTLEGRGVPTAKHFPGHGDTGVDSHLELPLVPYGRARLDSLELYPFRRALSAGVLSVMVGHLAVPALDPAPSTPASLSHHVTTGLLREELGFAGLIVTDAMDMRGVADSHSVGSRAVRSFLAGADIVLMPGDDEVALQALLAAARTGEIPAARLETSVRRVLGVKEWLGLDRDRFVDLEAVPSAVGTRESRLLAQSIARDAVTLLQNRNGALPLRRGDTGKTLVIALHGAGSHWSTVHRPDYPWPVEPAGDYLEAQLRRRGLAAEFRTVTPSDDDRTMDALVRSARDADRVIIPVFVEVRTGTGTIALPGRFERLVARLADLRKPTVVLSLGNPYVADRFAWADAVMCAYADAEPCVEAAVEAVFGESAIRGRLPITVSSRYPFGTGLGMPAVAVRAGTPEEAGFTRAGIAEVEAIVRAAIRDSAFPSAQLAVVRNGVLVLDRAYGTYTYDRTAREVTRRTMYDIASLTKVVGTTSAAMKLCEEGRLPLDTPVGRVLPAFRGGGKEKVTVYHLLTHTSGLPPFLKLIDIVATPEAALDTVLRTPLLAAPGDTTVYSDLGFILLAEMIRTVTGTPLDRYLQEQFFGPLGMDRTMFNPPPALVETVAPTEFDAAWRKRLVRGSVHDERSALLGGVAGHAGLFSTSGDLAVYMTMLMRGGAYGGTRFLQDTTVAAFTRQQSTRSSRALGWDTKSPTGSTAGDLFSPRSYGHTGFTGTSIWVDPDRALCVVFLTNRVHPTRANMKIAKVRPALHNAVVRAIADH